MNQVEHLIIQALTTADNNTLRKQAENGIFALVHENPSNFFISCATIVSNEGKNQNVRQQTATVMKAVLSKRVPLSPFRPKTMTTTGILQTRHQNKK
jgi:hypothetical protein